MWGNIKVRNLHAILFDTLLEACRTVVLRTRREASILNCQVNEKLPKEKVILNCNPICMCNLEQREKNNRVQVQQQRENHVAGERLLQMEIWLRSEYFKNFNKSIFFSLFMRFSWTKRLVFKSQNLSLLQFLLLLLSLLTWRSWCNLWGSQNLIARLRMFTSRLAFRTAVRHSTFASSKRMACKFSSLNVITRSSITSIPFLFNL